MNPKIRESARVWFQVLCGTPRPGELAQIGVAVGGSGREWAGVSSHDCG